MRYAAAMTQAKRLLPLLCLAALLAAVLMPIAAMGADAGADVGAIVVPAAPVAGPLVVVLSPDEVNGDTVRLAWSAITTRNWWAVGSIAVLLVVFAARKFGGAKWPWFRTPIAGKLLSAVGGTAAVAIMGLMAHQPPLDALVKAIGISAAGSGLFSWLSKSTPAAPPQ